MEPGSRRDGGSGRATLLLGGGGTFCDGVTRDPVSGTLRHVTARHPNGTPLEVMQLWLDRPGCMVVQGTMKRTADARLIRDNVVVWTGRLSGLRRFKDDVKEVEQGFECGISLEGYQDIKERDIVESFEIEEIKTKLF